ncbi:MAG: Holliday junction branch migration DNA helicase RuvB [Lactobacillaceae bacterium]|jgi:Holliday junction DNA helicase RuvB|nr:Holliday junction branch migration DNA helicase RuvB [Lactobacillaceae bacterium]
MDENLLQPEPNPEDNELSLRPSFLNEYIGQNEIKNKLKIYIQAALERSEPLDHVLLYGPPGLGKTTLSLVIANEMKANIKTTTGPAIEKAGDLVALLNELNPGDVLFIDEIHRIPKQVEEVLYSAMEDFFIDIVVGQGPSAHSIHFNLPPFTLIGATTRAGLLSAPLRDRFGISEHMQYYSISDLQEIAYRTAKIFDTDIGKDGALELALRSRGTPRILNRLLKRVRDFAQIERQSSIDYQIVNKSLNALHVDNVGLDEHDLKYLDVLINRFKGGPAGLGAIASNTGDEAETLEELIEPYLIQIGYVQRTSRGRIATSKAYEHLKIEHQGDLL